MNPKILLIFFIVNFASDSYGQKSKKFFRNDYTYIEEIQSFLKIHQIPLIWADAKRVCALEQAALFFPENNVEGKALVSFWNNTYPNIDWIFLGANDLFVEGLFETIDGRPVSDVYHNWYPGQPDNNGGVQSCVAMILEDGPGYLGDENCEEKFSFVCRKTLQSLQWNDQCNMPNLDYIFNKDNGNCYKLYTTPLNWTEAYAICQVEQSYLAVINTQQEGDFLAKLTVSTPKPRIKGKYSREKYHVGVHSRFNEGWQTIKRTPIDADLWFENYEPEVGDKNGECGSMLINGQLINTDCDTKSLFICEHAGQQNQHLTDPINAKLSSQPYVGGGAD